MWPCVVCVCLVYIETANSIAETLNTHTHLLMYSILYIPPGRGEELSVRFEKKMSVFAPTEHSVVAIGLVCTQHVLYESRLAQVVFYLESCDKNRLFTLCVIVDKDVRLASHKGDKVCAPTVYFMSVVVSLSVSLCERNVVLCKAI